MTTLTPTTTSGPPCPLPVELRAEIAYQRAQGHSWEDLGAAFGYDPDALRFATENDPEYDEEQRRAWNEVLYEAEAIALNRLRTLAAGNGPVALEALAILARHHQRRQREEAQLAAARRQLDEIAAAEQAHGQQMAVIAARTEELRKRAETR